MIDDGDPRVGPPKVRPGDTAWRWRIVRQATPEQRATGAKRGRPIYQRRVRVRCVCGHEDIVWEKDVITARSRGCRSKECMSVYGQEVTVQVRRATIEDVSALRSRHESAIAEIEAEIAKERAATEGAVAEMRRQIAEAEQALEQTILESGARIAAYEARKRAYDLVIGELKEAP